MSALGAKQPPRAEPPIVPQAAPGLRVARHREAIDAAIARAIASGQFILGAGGEAFEVEFARFLGAPFVIGVNSGTDALSLALLALGVEPGDEVILPALTAAGTAVAVRRIGAIARFVDVEPATRGIDPAAFASAISSRTAAVIVVHLHGTPALLPEILRIAAARGLAVVEDCAHAHGATIDGRIVGTLGDAAAFSFYPTKNLSAFGDAGMVSTRDEVTAERAKMLRAHGMRRRYYHDEVGGNSRLDTLQAAVLDVKLRRVEAGNARRRELASIYNERFTAEGLVGKTTAEGVVLPFTDPRAEHVFHQYVIRAPRRDALREYLTANGIGSEVYYPQPLHLQASLSFLGYKKGDFPVSEKAAEEVLALPIYPELRLEELESVVEAIRRFYA